MVFYIYADSFCGSTHLSADFGHGAWFFTSLILAPVLPLFLLYEMTTDTDTEISQRRCIKTNTITY